MSLNSSLGYSHLSILHLFIQKRKTWFGLFTLFISSPSKKKTSGPNYDSLCWRNTLLWIEVNSQVSYQLYYIKNCVNSNNNKVSPSAVPHPCLVALCALAAWRQWHISGERRSMTSHTVLRSRKPRLSFCFFFFLHLLVKQIKQSETSQHQCINIISFNKAKQIYINKLK